MTRPDAHAGAQGYAAPLPPPVQAPAMPAPPQMPAPGAPGYGGWSPGVVTSAQAYQAPPPGPAPGPPPPTPSGPGLDAAGSGDLPRTFFLGRYRVVDEIGVGGMASVHLARVDGPGGFQKWVAIKRIHPHLVEDDQFVDMFLDEARIAAGINHANVAQVFDLGKDDNTYWIAMEYLHGEPLREIMRRVEETNSRVPFHLAARVCADAAEGLHGAHELRGRNGQYLNLVHRDVTPHNLFVTYDGYTKVVDFGIAKVVDRLASTRAGTLKGKLAYMSPEQVRGQEVDRRTDIFALGVVLWELTTNQRLFRMDTDLDTLEKVQACVVPMPHTIVPDYPTELEQVVMKALAQRREDRFQTARELSRALQRFLMTQGTFVGPEDVGDYAKRLFTDRVVKRERYLEWAAEVTSAVDMDALQAQQKAAEQQSPSLLHEAASPVVAAAPAAPAPMPVATASHSGYVAPPLPTPQAPAYPGPSYTPSGSQPVAPAPQAYAPPPLPPPQAYAPPPPAAAPGNGAQPSPHRSHGQDYASASVVTTAPQLAAMSLMDEDEDIPTVVAQPQMRPGEAERTGPRPAAGAPMPEWDGAKTQLVEEQPSESDYEATLAFPDGQQAAQIRQGLLAADQAAQQQGGMPPRGAYPPAPTPAPMMAAPAMPAEMPAPQAQAIETKMSLPRPAAVAQWLMEQGDVEIQGPRSTGVIIAIAAIATLCVMGVASLIVYKLRLPARPDPTAVTIPAVNTGIPLDDDDPDAVDAPGKKSAAPKGKASKEAGGDAAGDKPAGTSAAAASTAEKPGTLTINCKPACDSITAAGTSLGPSPVFNHPMAPGQHRVTLKGNDKSKTIVVQITSGQLTTHTVTMK